MFELTEKRSNFLVSQPETGTGYHIITIILYDGKRYDHVIANSGYITQVKGYNEIPFAVADIKEIIITHDKWKFDIKK